MSKKIPSLLCLALLTASMVFSMGKQAHDFDQKECGICHTTESNRITAEVYSALTSKCMSCHTTLYDNGYMHPVDIRPAKVIVPLDFPLSPSGTLTCVTCHDIHASPVTPAGDKSSFLRRNEAGKIFCDICHQNSNTLTQGGHETVLREAHFESNHIAADQDLAIDALSRNCLTCHDGSLGTEVHVSAGDWSHSENFIGHDNGGMHPIGMRYRDIASSKPKAALRPIDQVDKRIRFFDDGKVGCGSCHDPYSIIPKKLVIEDFQSQLCFACHKMDGR